MIVQYQNSMGHAVYKEVHLVEPAMVWRIVGRSHLIVIGGVKVLAGEIPCVA